MRIAQIGNRGDLAKLVGHIGTDRSAGGGIARRARRLAQRRQLQSAPEPRRKCAVDADRRGIAAAALQRVAMIDDMAGAGLDADQGGIGEGVAPGGARCDRRRIGLPPYQRQAGAANSKTVLRPALTSGPS